MRGYSPLARTWGPLASKLTANKNDRDILLVGSRKLADFDEKRATVSSHCNVR